MFLRIRVPFLNPVFLTALALVSGMLSNLASAQAPAATIFDAQLDRIEQLLPSISNRTLNCDNNKCGPPVCEGQLDVFRDLVNLTPVLEQYVKTLNAEDAILTRGTDDMIAASDLSAAALEGARMAAKLTHMTDQALGAVVELNGITNTILTGSTDPVAVWELAKDVNSIVNRIYENVTQTGNHIESISYDPELKSGQGTGINIKDIEDAYIDIWSVGIEATGKLLSEKENKADQRPSKTNIDPKKLIKQNTSNIADAVGIVKNLIEQAQNIKGAVGKIDSLETYYKRYTKDASPQVRRTLDAAFKKELAKQKKLIIGQKRIITGSETTNREQTAFVLTQVGARVVQTYYSAEKLKAFRKRITQLRSQAVQAGDRYLDVIEERDQVRDRSRRAANLLEQLRAVSNQIRSCAFKKCSKNLNSIEMIILPALTERPNGDMQYARGQAQISPILAALTDSLSQNITNKGGVKPNYPNGTKIFGPRFFDTDFKARCEKCQRHFNDALAASRERKFILWHLDHLDDGGQLKRLNARWDIALKDAKDLQKIYNSKTDGSISRRLVNLTDDAMQELSELSSQIRRKTSEARSYSRQIKVIQRNRQQTIKLRKQTSKQRAKEKSALQNLEICNSEVCVKGRTFSDLKRSYPDVANGQDKCAVPNVIVVGVLNSEKFGCHQLGPLKPGQYIRDNIGIPPDSVYLDYDRDKPLPPFGPEDKLSICMEPNGSGKMMRDEMGRLIVVGFWGNQNGVDAKLKYSNGYRSPEADEVFKFIEIHNGVQSGKAKGLFSPSIELPAIVEPKFIAPKPMQPIAPPTTGESRFIGRN